VLASVVDEALSGQQFDRVRSSLLSMADLLESLEAGLARAAGASQGLRMQVDKLNDVMRSRRKLPQRVITQPQQQLQIGPQNTPATSTPNATYSQAPPIIPHSGSMDFQLPPELFGDWSWPPEAGGQQQGFYSNNWLE